VRAEVTPERWQQVNIILEQVWEHDADHRAAFLERACGGDAKLRSCVEALLASDENAGEFLASTAIEQLRVQGASTAAMPLGGSEPEMHIGPYRVLREIGHGGMGTVYLAERADGEYRKRVAIKIVSRHLVSEETLRRFHNERQVEAALDHQNIARLLDGGTTEDGLPYLVLEYVEGKRIDAWCDTHMLSVHKRLKLFQQVCAAVQHAHDAGVIHRDIKPANILVTADGTPKLLDFGIAKVLNTTLSNPAETTIGFAPMTPEYASPEQTRGDAVGPASDIYSLGLVVHLLVTGELVHSAPIMPHELDSIVSKALREEPEQRYESVSQFSEDVGRFLAGLPVHAHPKSLLYRGRKFLKRKRGPATAAVIGAALVLGMMAGIELWLKPVPEAGVRSIAVLPLENLSNVPEQDYFADGITDELIGELALIRDLRVISRTSVMSYKGARKSLPDIGRRLHVGTITEGSVQRSGNYVQIAIRLVDVAKDAAVWSGKYEGAVTEVAALQAQVVEAIANEIHVILTAPDRARLSRERRVNVASYDAYLKAQHEYFSAYNKQTTQNAIARFLQSLALDPRYAPAYVGMASCYWGLSSVYDPPTDVMPKAKWAALKALELDDSLGEAHGLLGVIFAGYEFNRANARKEFLRAVELKPGDSQIHLWLSIFLAEMGEFDAAVAESEQAQKLDPVSPFVSSYSGVPLFLAHRYDQLIERLQPLSSLDPNQQQAHAFLALAYEQKGALVKAIAEMEKAYELDKDQDALAQLGHMYAVAGRTTDARRVLRELAELSRKRYVSAYNIAVLYAGLGETDEAFRWFDKVEQDRSEWFAAFNVDPRLSALHSDPRFKRILRKVGLD
jgi:TolB-like protein/Flp pilus assembly protein TadD